MKKINSDRRTRREIILIPNRGGWVAEIPRVEYIYAQSEWLILYSAEPIKKKRNRKKSTIFIFVIECRMLYLSRCHSLNRESYVKRKADVSTIIEKKKINEETEWKAMHKCEQKSYVLLFQKPSEAKYIFFRITDREIVDLTIFIARIHHTTEARSSVRMPRVLHGLPEENWPSRSSHRPSGKLSSFWIFLYPFFFNISITPVFIWECAVFWRMGAPKEP